MDDVSERSFVMLTDEHLERLSGIAQDVFQTLMAKPDAKSRVYADRMLMVALCQGSALHFVDGVNGVKDLDVWGFFRSHPDQAFPSIAKWKRDFGPSSLGRHPYDVGYRGRRIDIFGRAIAAEDNEDGPTAVQRWLTNRFTNSASHLARKAVVAIYPAILRGTIVWSLPGAGT